MSIQFYRPGLEPSLITEYSDFVLKLGRRHYDLFSNQSKTLCTDLPPLYKKDARGEWQIMQFYLVLTTEGPVIRREVVRKGGKLQGWSSVIKKVPSKMYSRVCEEKLQSVWNKKRNRDGWADDKEEPILSEPMLLHHYDLYSERIVFPAIQMPKLNGIRATWKPHHGLMSRKRNHFHIAHLEEQLTILGMTVDGELWHPEWDLETIVSIVKGGPRKFGQDQLEYHIFNRPQGGNFINRMATLMERWKAVSGDTPNLKVIPMQVVHSHEDILANHSVIKKMQGVDGSVVCNIDYEYKFDTRSYDILKVKDIISEEFKCRAVGYDEDVTFGKMIKLRFTHKGMIFTAIPSGTKEERRAMYQVAMGDQQHWIGQLWTIEFREWTTKGVPRHIVSCIKRDYE